MKDVIYLDEWVIDRARVHRTVDRFMERGLLRPRQFRKLCVHLNPTAAVKEYKFSFQKSWK